MSMEEIAAFGLTTAEHFVALRKDDVWPRNLRFITKGVDKLLVKH